MTEIGPSRNNAHFGSPETIRYCGVLRYFESPF